MCSIPLYKGHSTRTDMFNLNQTGCYPSLESRQNVYLSVVRWELIQQKMSLITKNCSLDFPQYERQMLYQECKELRVT